MISLVKFQWSKIFLLSYLLLFVPTIKRRNWTITKFTCRNLNENSEVFQLLQFQRNTNFHFDYSWPVENGYFSCKRFQIKFFKQKYFLIKIVNEEKKMHYISDIVRCKSYCNLHFVLSISRNFKRFTFTRILSLEVQCLFFFVWISEINFMLKSFYLFTSFNKSTNENQHKYGLYFYAIL